MMDSERGSHSQNPQLQGTAAFSEAFQGVDSSLLEDSLIVVEAFQQMREQANFAENQVVKASEEKENEYEEEGGCYEEEDEDFEPPEDLINKLPFHSVLRLSEEVNNAFESYLKKENPTRDDLKDSIAEGLSLVGKTYSLNEPFLVNSLTENVKKDGEGTWPPTPLQLAEYFELHACVNEILLNFPRPLTAMNDSNIFLRTLQSRIQNILTNVDVKLNDGYLVNICTKSKLKKSLLPERVSAYTTSYDMIKQDYERKMDLFEGIDPSFASSKHDHITNGVEGFRAVIYELYDQYIEEYGPCEPEPLENAEEPVDYESDIEILDVIPQREISKNDSSSENMNEKMDV